jgi:hypothetical protein
VDAVAVGAEAEQLAEDLRAAGLGALERLEDQSGRALADDQAVALAVERARAEVGGVD